MPDITVTPTVQAVTITPTVQSITVTPGGVYNIGGSDLEIELGGPSSGRNYTLGNLVNSIEEGSGSTANVVLGGGTTGQPNLIAGLSIVRSIVGGYDNYIGRAGAVDGSGDTGLAASIVGGKHCLIRRPNSTGDHTANNPVAVTASQVAGTFPNHGMICGSGYSEIRNGVDGFIGGGYGHALYQTDATNGKGDKAFIGGGYGNGVSGDYGAIVAGNANRVSQAHGFIGNGFECEVVNTPGFTEGSSAIVNGYQNKIYDSSYAFIGGGGNNIAGQLESSNASFGVIGGGYQNTICNDQYAHSVGGYGWASVISGGWKNSISVGYASIPGGYMNRVEALYGSASGSDAVSHTPYLHAIGHQQETMDTYASGKHQIASGVFRATTTDGISWVYATANGENLTVRENMAVSIRGLVIAKEHQGSRCHGWEFHGVLNNYAGTLSMVGSWTITAIGATPSTGWDFDPTIVSNSIGLRCRGAASTTVNWTVRIDIAEVYAEPPEPV
jgi:hypothetical protein